LPSRLRISLRGRGELNILVNYNKRIFQILAKIKQVIKK
jgi:hypothetical protein